MSSKQLDSILRNVPPATVRSEETDQNTSGNTLQTEKKIKEETDRIVAVIPKELKQQIKDYIKIHKKETERTVILKALKLMGFTVHPHWIIDKRSLR